MFHFDRVLSEDERIVWVGKPRLGAWIASRTALLNLFIVFGWFIMLMPLISLYIHGEPIEGISSYVVLYSVGLLCQVPLVMVIYQAVFDYPKIAYAVTTKRLLFQRPGNMNTIDMVSISFDDVKDMQLNQGFVDMLFGGRTRSVLFSTEDSYSHHYKYGWQYKPKRFEHVERAEEVLRVYLAFKSGSSEEVATLPSLDPIRQVVPAYTTLTTSPFLPKPMQAMAELDVDLIAEFRSVLKPGEQPLWQGRPKARPFVFSYLPLYTVSILGIILVIYRAEWSTLSQFSDFLGYAVMISFLTIGPITYRLLAYSNTAYLITDHRVLVQGGVIGKDVESFEREQITDVKIKRSGLDRLLGGDTGTVTLETYNRRNMAAGSIWWRGNELEYITDAEKVYRLLRPQSSTVVGVHN